MMSSYLRRRTECVWAAVACLNCEGPAGKDRRRLDQDGARP